MPSDLPTKQSIQQSLQHIQQVLLSPSETITNIKDRRQVQLLSPTLLVIVTATSIGGVASVSDYPRIATLLWATTVGLVAAYVLSRTRYFVSGIVLALAVMSFAPFGAVIVSGHYSPAEFAMPFLWSVLTLILGQIFLPARGLIGLIVAHLVGILLFLFVPGVTLLTILHPIGVILPASLLLLVASWHHNALERDRAQEADAHRTEHQQRLEALIAKLGAANEELTQISRLKDEFLASMSHELRTPLNVIIGMAEILGEEVYGSLTEQQRESVAMIETSGQHLLDMINDILDLSKIGAGKLILEVGPVSVKDICEASLRLTRQPAHKKHLAVELHIDPAITNIMADQRRLKQILINLLSNAIKFTPDSGTIGLEVLGDAKKQVIHFVVWDSGIGIAKENMERLFRPFVQLDSSLSRQYDGSGLGLSLVYRLTEIQGGSVSVESIVDQGSRFTVSLPWQPAEITSATDDSQEPKPKMITGPLPPLRTPPPLILLAEDNEASLKTLSDYLQAKRYHVREARNGQEVLKLVSEQTPSLILMDIQMPGIDGLEAIRRIRANPKLVDVPIIALTALAMPGDHERCMAAGANAYVSKPVRPGGLVEMIEAHLLAKGGNNV